MTELSTITQDNFVQAFELKLAKGQEEFVSHPVRSLAQAYVYREQCQPFGIYDGGRTALDTAVLSLKSILPGHLYSDLTRAYDSYGTDSEADICDDAENYFYSHEQEILNILQSFADKLEI